MLPARNCGEVVVTRRESMFGSSVFLRLPLTVLIPRIALFDRPEDCFL